MKINFKSIKAKIILTSVFSGVSLALCLIPIQYFQMKGAAEQSVENIRSILLERFDETIKSEIESAHSVVAATYARFQKGEISEEQARSQAAELVRRMKYGKDGYFWIDTYEGMNVAFLGKESEGKSRWDAKDSAGKLFIQEIIKNGQRAEGGFTEYSFPRKDSTVAYPKRSYSLAFVPFRWVIGTGNYIDDIEAYAANKSEILAAQVRRRILQQMLLIFALSAVATLVAFRIGAKIGAEVQGISMGLIEGAVGLRSSIGTILAVSHDLKNISSKQSEIVHKTASAMEQISTAVRGTAERADSSEKISNGSKEKAETGRKIVSQMSDAIAGIVNTNEAVVKAIGDNNSKMGKVSQMIKEIDSKTNVINDIVFQTKLLSFNASVEAARAGEHGKGFAVVAEEVGNLAQNSGSAAKEISHLIETSTQQVQRIADESKTITTGIVDSAQDSVKKGSDVAEACAKVLEEIVVSSVSVSSSISEIALAAKEQSTAVTEISSAIHDIDQTTQVASRSGEAAAGAAQSLAERTRRITGMAFSLESLIQGRKILPKFEWVDDFNLGIADMDEEHKVLVDKMNAFAGAMEGANGTTAGRRVSDAFLDLLNYTQKHFADEERFMQSFSFGDLAPHKRIHSELLAKLEAFRDPVSQGRASPDELMDFLIHWLMNHILNNDRKYASTYQQVRRSA